MKKKLLTRGMIALAAVLIVLVFGGTSALYQHGTQDSLEAVVTGTERVCETTDEGQACHWMVLTDRMSFTNQDAFWHFKFDSTDLQAKLAEGELYTFHYYGWRIPFLSVYPNIISVE